MTLEKRVARLEDRAELNDLVVAYFLASDGDDLVTIGNSFTDTATFSTSGVVAGAGRDAIVAFIATARGHMGLTIHTPHYAQFAFEGPDVAKGLVGAHLELVLGSVAFYGAVRYVDEYRRTADGWRIQTRDMRTINMSPWLEVGEAFASATPVRWPGAEPSPSDFPRKG